jgi:sec-independent protein translocase protein TatB
MLGLGFWELVILGLIALIVIGPERLPDFAKGVAKFLNDMRRTASDLKRTFDDEKDIFKENIDQLQKLKNDIQSFPELDSQTKSSNNPYQLDQAEKNPEPVEEQLNLLDPFDHEEMPYDSHAHHDDPLDKLAHDDLHQDSNPSLPEGHTAANVESTVKSEKNTPSSDKVKS